MKTIITTIMGMLLLLSAVSAEVIIIEPEVLEPFSIYSGESITRNITIKTDGNYLVYLSWGVEGNSSDMEGFSVDYESPIQVNKEKEVQITLSAVYNFIPDSFTINFDATTEIEEPQPTIIYRGSRTKKIYVENKTIEYIENKTVEIITCDDDEIVEDTESFFDSDGFRIRILMAIAIITIIVLIWREWLIKKLKGGKTNGNKKQIRSNSKP